MSPVSRQVGRSLSRPCYLFALMPTADVLTGVPHSALRRYVDRYVGYRLEGYPPGVHRGLPTRLLTFIVQLDAPRAFVAGLRTTVALLPHDGQHHGIAIELTVRGARALFGTPSGALTETTVELSDLLGREVATLSERLAGCAAWAHRFAILDQLLLASLERGREPASEVVHAFDVLTTSREGMRIEALAQAVGWSRRHFSEVIGREVGLSPRQLVRVIRFERSCHLVRSMPRYHDRDRAERGLLRSRPHAARVARPRRLQTGSMAGRGAPLGTSRSRGGGID